MEVNLFGSRTTPGRTSGGETRSCLRCSPLTSERPRPTPASRRRPPPRGCRLPGFRRSGSAIRAAESVPSSASSWSRPAGRPTCGAGCTAAAAEQCRAAAARAERQEGLDRARPAQATRSACPRTPASAGEQRWSRKRKCARRALGASGQRRQRPSRASRPPLGPGGLGSQSKPRWRWYSTDAGSFVRRSPEANRQWPCQSTPLSWPR